jgi:cysteine desulfurase
VASSGARPAAFVWFDVGSVSAQAAGLNWQAARTDLSRMAASVYLDNAAVAPMPPPVLEALAAWTNRGALAGGYAAAREGRRLLEAYRGAVAAEGGFSLEGPRGYQVLVTSGGAEANAHVLTAAVRAYARRTRQMPHLVTCAAEDPSVLACCRALAADQMARVTVLPVSKEGEGVGSVAPAALRAALRPNTCLVSLCAVNSATGVLNPLQALAAEAHAARVPFHSDARLLFGRSAFRPRDWGLDAFSASARFYGGPLGAGLLALRRDFVDGYGLGPLVAGPQEGGLRGGEPNLPAIAAAFAALRWASAERGEKNRRQLQLRQGLRAGLERAFFCLGLEAYRAARPRGPGGAAAPPEGPRAQADARALDAAADSGETAVVFVSPPEGRRGLPGLFLFAPLTAPPEPAARLARRLEAQGLVVGLAEEGGLGALELPPEVETAALRVGFGDLSGPEDLRLLLAGLGAAFSPSQQ